MESTPESTVSQPWCPEHDVKEDADDIQKLAVDRKSRTEMAVKKLDAICDSLREDTAREERGQYVASLFLAKATTEDLAEDSIGDFAMVLY